jgi:hypothetical protein
MSDCFKQCFNELQALGFLVGADAESSLELFTHRWDSWEAHQGVTRELMLASLDSQRVWMRDLKLCDQPWEAYLEALLGWASISQGSFRPEQPKSELAVEFSLDGYRFRFQPKPGHYLDMGLLDVVNSSLYGGRRFEVSDQLGMPNFVLMLDAEGKAALEKRGWHLLARPAWRYGFLWNYWEQGMEEPPWLVFQDRCYCASRDQDWQRDGMVQLSPGDELEILEHDGSRVWAGTLKARPKSWFAWLAPLDANWNPAEIEPDLWKSYFYRSPPLRANYRSATQAS